MTHENAPLSESIRTTYSDVKEQETRSINFVISNLSDYQLALIMKTM